MSMKSSNNSLDESIAAPKSVLEEGSGPILAGRNLGSDDITLVDNYSESYENLASFKGQEPKNKTKHPYNHSKQFKKPTLKFKKPTFKRSPVDALSVATTNIQKTANTIRLVANSVDGIVSSLEILGPVISSMSRENINSNVGQQNFMSTTNEDSDYSRSTSDVTKFSQKSKSPQNPADLSQLLKNPLVQNMLEDMKSNPKK